MSRFNFRYLAFIQGCEFSPQATAFTPTVTPAPIQIEAPANLTVQTDTPSSGLHIPTEHIEGCGLMDEPEGIDIRVRAGETLDHFARWSDSTVEELAVANEIEVQTPLVPGQALLLPLYSSDLDSFEKERKADAEARLARYISSHGGLAGIAAHEVKRGETGWRIAKREAKVPLWVLGAFNTSVNMDSLRAGDTLYIPVLGEALGAQFDAQAEALLDKKPQDKEE